MGKLREKLYKMDDKILSYCTKISHYLQRTFGITNYTIAKFGCVLSALGVALSALNYFYKFLPYKTPMAILVLDSLWICALFYRTTLCIRAEEELLSGSRIKLAEILISVTARGFRIFWVLYMLLTLPLNINFVMQAKNHLARGIDSFALEIGLFVFYYFIAVDGLPPGVCRVKAWIKNLFVVLQPAEQRN